MARYQVTLAYDGTGFSGFQRQAEARTVQAEVETALRELGWQEQSLAAAGRTDTGVHATGQVIAFDLDWSHTPEDLLRALNARLAEDVAARGVHPAGPDFHPRYSAVGRRYQYRLFCDQRRHPIRERYAWRVWPPVDAGLLQEAAALLVGTQDFAAFGSPPKAGGSTIRSVSEAGWSQDGPYLVFEILANAFLYHMVRRLVSFQVEIGQGRHELALLSHFLESPEEAGVQGLAPAHGLTLVEVIYPSVQASKEITRNFEQEYDETG